MVNTEDKNTKRSFTHLLPNLAGVRGIDLHTQSTSKKNAEHRVKQGGNWDRQLNEYD